MRRVLLGVGVFGLIGIVVAPAAMARPPYMMAFQKQYSIGADSNLGKAGCGVCHVMPTKPPAGWTRFGKDLAVALGKKRATGEEVTAALPKIETESIGMETYLARIKADKLPAGD